MTILDVAFVNDGWLQIFVDADINEGKADERDLVIGLKELFEPLISLGKRNR